MAAASPQPVHLMDRPDVLVVAATQAEAAHAPAGLEVLICGIGKVDAAVAVTRALAIRSQPRRPMVVNIGTAGALQPNLSGLFLPSLVLNSDLSADVLSRLGYSVTAKIDIDRGDGTILATGDRFITDPAARNELAARADLVDMEGFAIARACQAFGACCRLVKHVSDAADESAMNWPERVDASAWELGRWLGRVLKVQ